MIYLVADTHQGDTNILIYNNTLIYNKMTPPVLRPAFLRLFHAKWAFFPIADRRQA
jgi:hypothetical protein